MNPYFICQNGQNISWTFLCDGYNQCLDGSDERNCYCHGDIYACVQGNNVSCKIACATYGRVTCLTYQNTRACEQYLQGYTSTIGVEISSTTEHLIFTNNFNTLRYSTYLVISLMIFLSIVFMLIYLIRKNSSKFLFAYINKGFNENLNQISTDQLSFSIEQSLSPLNQFSASMTSSLGVNELPPSYDDVHQNSMSTNDYYEPPPYSSPQLFSLVQRSCSLNYESMKRQTLSSSMSMLQPILLPEQNVLTNIRTYSV